MILDCYDFYLWSIGVLQVSQERLKLNTEGNEDYEQ